MKFFSEDTFFYLFAINVYILQLWILNIHTNGEK